jgi:hypothetical protein
MPMKNPTHLGDFIRTEIMDAAGLTVTAAAIALTRLAADVIQSAQWQGRPLRGYGAPHRESLWSKDGYADAYAVVLRHCPNTQAKIKSVCRAFPYWPLRISDVRCGNLDRAVRKAHTKRTKNSRQRRLVR